MNIYQDEATLMEQMEVEEEREKHMTKKEKLQEKLDSYIRMQRNLSIAIEGIKKEIEKL